MSGLLRLILGDPDGRTPGEVRRDVDDELEFHLAMLRDELRGEGLSEGEARVEAERRFGDVDRYRKLCAEVALKERRMLARINLVLLVIVMVGVGVLSWRSFSSQARTAEAVERLSLKIEQLSAGGGGGGGGSGGLSERGTSAKRDGSVSDQLGAAAVTLDRFGRAAELRFTAEMIERNKELREQMFAAYDEKCRRAGYSTLQGRTQTVLIVGEVDRPGVYAVYRDDLPGGRKWLRLGEVLSAAGVESSAATFHVWSAAVTESEGEWPMAEAFSKEAALSAGAILCVSKQPAEWLKFNWPYANVQLLRSDGQRRFIAEFFSAEAWGEIERWRRYDKILQDLMKVGVQSRDERGELLYIAAGQLFNDREMIGGAIDLIIAGTDPRGQRLIIGFGGQSVTATLAMVLAGQDGVTQKDANELDTFASQIRGLALKGTVRVRVIDRLSGSTDPVIDLPWDEAKVSQAVVAPGSLVVFSNVVKNEATGKPSP